ncbi:MAG: sugar phosphate isomerase/epimerase family protein [Hydrogenoanaerobacterium sp.]
MKIAFSTLGCPGWSWDEIFATAKDLGFDGIEIRGVGSEIYAPKIKQFLPQNLDNTMQRLKNGGLQISILTSGAVLGFGDASSAQKEAEEYINLAEKMGVKYVRVLISGAPRAADKEDLTACAAAYRLLCEYAASRGVTPLIETTGKLANSEKMREFMEQAHENSGVLWDIHHPYRFFGEAPLYTYKNIGKYVKYVHVKDSIGTADDVKYRMMGYGDVPVLDTLKILNDNNYDGFISLEWLKRWNPDLQEPGIVFSHFTNYIAVLTNQL